MARSGSSSKFVPVNLNNSYGQMLPQSNGVSSASSGLGRSRSFSSSYGSMVSLSRSTRVSSPSATVSTQSRASKLAVPRPVNLPSLRREHSGNDPSIALVGSAGSSGWNKQSGDETVDSSAARSDAIKGDPSTWMNRPRPPAPDGSTQVGDRNSLRQPAYSPPGHGDALTRGITVLPPVEKAVVFRGEDFPTLQAVAAPFSPSIHPPRSLDLLSKQRDKRHDGSDEPKKMEQSSSDHVQQSNVYFDQQFQPVQPVQIQVRGTIPDQSGGGAYPRGPSPLVKLTPTSNWADDERETLPNFRLQESTQCEWTDSNNGFRGNWLMDHSTDTELKRPTPRTGYPSRNDADPSMRMGSPYKASHVKGVDFNRGASNGSARFEFDNKESFDRMSNNTGRNDFLKRGWSFSGAEVSLNQDGRLVNPSSVSEWGSHVNGRPSFREGNSVRQDTTDWDMSSRKARPGLHYQEARQGQETKFTKTVLFGRQGFSGGALPGPRIGQGPSLAYGESDASVPMKLQPFMDFRREKRPSGLYGHVHNDDPFLEHGLRTRPTSMYAMQPRTKDTVKDDDYRDPARESFEAELERVEKMLEQERQRAVEERERAFERARKEHEEQERLAREEEEMRVKLEEEAREASYRAERWAEDAARKVEEARKAREEEKRMAELEEDRRKEAARKKLLELEERMAKREVERIREDARRTERDSVLRGDLGTEHGDSSRSDDTNGGSHWKSGKIDENDDERMSSMEPLTVNASSLPSILKSQRLPPYSKEENGAVAGARRAEAWTEEDLASGQERLSGHLRNDRRQQDHEDRQWGPSFKTASVRKSAVPAEHSRSNIDLDAADDRNWWVRDSSNKSSDLLAAYPQSADSSDYPSYGRLRQSLPKQPRVLPPPPGPTTFRKQFPQRDDGHCGASTFDNECNEVAPTLKEGYFSTKSDESTHAVIKNILITNAQASEQFDTLPSEEVVLSDAGSQFSDDTAEDAYQEQELHSDAVSETYTEGNVDEISDLTEAQESSEDGESQKPTDWEASTGELKSEKDGASLEYARNVSFGSSEETDAGKAGSITYNEKEEEGTVVDEDVDSEKSVTSSLVGVKVGSADMDGSACVSDESEKTAFRQLLEPAGLKDGQEKAGNAEELAPENVEQDEEVKFSPYQAPLLPVCTQDATQLRHFEDLSLRQSLVQQFQQPFSFMAVPLPQSTLNHVGASGPMVTPMNGLPNHQELPFHLRLGLLPGMPLMPNAIQIGSIQMPLHIHPQIPQIAAVHGQQTPVFQFGQIGPSLSISQPLPITHMPQPAVHMHHATGQVRVTQNQHAQVDCSSAIDGTNDSLDLNWDAKFGNTASADDASLLSTGCTDYNENAEVMVGASASIEGPTITSEGKVESALEEPETQCATVSLSELEAQTCQTKSTEDTFEDGDREYVDLKARPGLKPSRGGRRRIKPPPYHGILGRGRGRFCGGGQNYFYQAPHLAAEIRPETRPKRAARGKMVRRNYRRAEYRVRERPTTLFDAEVAAAEVLPGPASNSEDVKESGGYLYVKRGAESALKNVSEENVQSVGSGSLAVQTTARGDQTVNQSALAQAVKTKGLPGKFEMERGEDPPFRTGVVRVFDQPGIETPNDKDDFIKVRSKRQLLRELKEQREKESNVKATDSGSRDQLSKKQQRPAKPGINSGAAGVNSNKHAVKRRPVRNAVIATTNGKPDIPSLINSATNISSPAAGVAKRTLTSPMPGRAASASNSVTTGAKIGGNFAQDNQNCEQSTTSAWGGQRSNQEVVSLTQIQLEEAMKPFRLDAPFSESTHLSEMALASLELGSCGTSGLAVEKTVITSGPLSSLLAGEKIQFGAVTSPTCIPEKSNSAPPFSGIRTGSPLGFGSDSSHIPRHSSSFVANFPEPDSACKDDGFEGLEAEAEAAASAVVAAAISSEDPIESSNTIESEKNTGCTTVTSSGLLAAANVRTTQIQNTPLSDNQMAVALPADLSVETSQSLFQGSPMNMSNLSAMMLQSLPTGAPAFPHLEMGPLIGGPIFNFSPREEPVLSRWQQRPMGTPDSFYGAAPFLSPASIQGHPHMLVYTNPYTSVGQFGQLGVSFMGATYHPSGKQPDWTHIPLSSTPSGLMGSKGDLGSTSNGVVASQHLFGPSSLGPAQRTAVPGSSLMSVVAAPNVFDPSLGAPFQVPHMDGYVQSHWSKAPAPPAYNAPTSGPSLPIQNMPSSVPPLDLNMQTHSSAAFSNHLMAHSIPVVESSSRFHQPPDSNPVTSGSFLPADARFPDELGLGDSTPTVVTSSSSDAGSLIPEAGKPVSLPSEPTGIKMQQRGRRPARSSQGHLSGANDGSTSVESYAPSSDRDHQSRSGNIISPESQNKILGRIGSPNVSAHSWRQFTEQRVASKQALPPPPREGAGSERPRMSQKRGASGRVSTSDKGAGALPSKLKQIYVAKPVMDGRKLSAACS